ncbi:MAG: C40 family peptidase [Bacteroidales bacterium]|nr:C40 family peptidase [Bacteroidales bacterium]
MKSLRTYAIAILAVLLGTLNAAAREDEPLPIQIVEYAKTFIGRPYRLGAPGPREFDCSSFTSYVFGHFGYNLPAYSKTQFKQGRKVERYAELQLGDLVFFGKRAGARDIGHVGIVVQIDQETGSFSFIHASVTKGVTIESANHPYFQMRYMGARRIIPDWTQ